MSYTLCNYEFTIRHQKGDQMRHAYAFSRAPISEENRQDSEKIEILATTTREDEILLYQRSGESVKRLIQNLQKPDEERSKDERGVTRDYRLEGLLYRVNKRDNIEVLLYVIPASMRKALTIGYYDLASHLGIDKVLAMMCRYYYIPKMRDLRLGNQFHLGEISRFL